MVALAVALTSVSVATAVPTTIVVGHLPSGSGGSSGVATDGTYIYVFGGRHRLPDNGYDLWDVIQRFDPATNQVKVMDAPLPRVETHGVAVWDGQAFDILGGEGQRLDGSYEELDQVVRYDPATDSVQTAQSLPGAFYTGAAFYDGHKTVFALGVGLSPTDVAWYWPGVGNEKSTPRGGTTFGTVSAVTVVWDGTQAWMFDGISPVSVFDPANNSWSTRPALPYVMQDTSVG